MREPHSYRYYDHRPKARSWLVPLIFIVGTIVGAIVLFPPWQSKEERLETVRRRIEAKIGSVEQNVTLEKPAGVRTDKTLSYVGRPFKVIVYHTTKEDANRLVERTFAEIAAAAREVEEMVVSLTDSHKALGGRALAEDLRTHLNIAQLSDGRYDPTVEPLWAAYGFQSDQRRIPSARQVRSAVGVVDYRKLKVGDCPAETDEVNEGGPAKACPIQLRNTRGALALDLIAPGYVLKAARRILQSEQTIGWAVFAGRNVICSGHRGRGDWTFEMNDPRDLLHQFGTVSPPAGALAMAGVRDWIVVERSQQAHRYLNAATGIPGREAHFGAIWGEDPTITQVLAYLAIVVPEEEYLALLTEHFSNYEYVVLTKDHRELVSEGLKDHVDLERMLRGELRER